MLSHCVRGHSENVGPTARTVCIKNTSFLALFAVATAAADAGFEVH